MCGGDGIGGKSPDHDLVRARIYVHTLMRVRLFVHTRYRLGLANDWQVDTEITVIPPSARSHTLAHSQTQTHTYTQTHGHTHTPTQRRTSLVMARGLVVSLTRSPKSPK
jgi:diadenosine tetraphosphatase ApaH/serine/threonine PP2A family protein phosphatase